MKTLGIILALAAAGGLIALLVSMMNKGPKKSATKANYPTAKKVTLGDELANDIGDVIVSGLKNKESKRAKQKQIDLANQEMQAGLASQGIDI